MALIMPRCPGYPTGAGSGGSVLRRDGSPQDHQTEMTEHEPQRATSRRSLVGRVLAERYRVTRVAAAGANTLIVDAADLQADRPVTLKLVRPELAESADFRRDFRAAMETVSRLTHPNLATVHDWGEEVVGKRTTVFVVVEHLSSGSLRDLFDRGRLLSPSQALIIGLEACRGLDFAHRQGLVHTELSPAKLVFGDDRRLRIVDFGLARLLGRTAWAEPANVATHVARYSSPEQALGQPVDGKTDVYSLALSLTEAVTGTVPFAARSTVATLSARIGRLMPVSADLGPLASVLERAARPEPGDRSSAAEFGRALVGAAEKLPRPAPLPLVLPVLDEHPERMRRPDDPTGGLTRPPDAPAATPLVPPAAGVQPSSERGREVEPDAVPGTEPVPAPEPVRTGAMGAATAGSRPAPPPPPVAAPSAAAEGSPRLYDGDEDLTVDELAALATVAPRDDDATTAEPAASAAPPEPPEPVARRPAERRERRRRPWLTVLGTLLLLGAVGALAYVAYQLFQAPTHEVPPLAGMTEAEARAAVAEFEWDVEVQRERSDDEPDVGDVVRSAPSVGESLGEGEPFLIVVSEGPELRPLPQLNGLTAVEAETALAEERLRALPATDAFHEEVPRGSVISWSVPSDPTLTAGSEVLPGTEVAFVLSAGPEPRTVPDLVGVTVRDSTALLEGLRLEPRIGRSVFNNTIPKDAVVRVRPEVGTEVPRGAPVTLVVSKGPDLVTMPDLQNFTVNRSRLVLQRAGLRTGNLLGSTRGRFVSASVDGEQVEPGAQLLRGTAVDLVFL
jgi:serine/threonine-protein kinase